MIAISIPAYRELALEHLVLDYNGTLAVDGTVIPGVIPLLKELSALMQLHVITADTFGQAGSQLSGLTVTLTILSQDAVQAEAKLAYVNRLGPDSVVAIGNGRNDRTMVKVAAIGIALVQKEGGASETLVNADVVSSNILDALNLLKYPKRLIATLRG
ncbi:HAD family hydrolase [soil metagenome]